MKGKPSSLGLNVDYVGLVGSDGVYIGEQLTENGEFLNNALHYSGDRHIITFWPTGSGKNTTSQTPFLLSSDASALIVDVKCQLFAITSRYRKDSGHKIAIMYIPTPPHV